MSMSTSMFAPLRQMAPMATRSLFMGSMPALRVISRSFANFAPCDTVEQFIKQNVDDCQHNGDDSFLVGPTERTKKLWKYCEDLLVQEHNKNGCLSIEDKTVSGVTAFGPGYITGKKEDELIVGLQTTKPLERAMKPLGGINMVKSALEGYGHKLDPEVEKIFTKYRKTHNECVFDLYTPEMKQARKQGILTGLPDAYSRGRIIGDYRRCALFGLDEIIKRKEADKAALGPQMNEETLRLREEVADQIKALKELKELGNMYGYDLSKPAETAHQAIQHLYFAFLGCIKSFDGAAMSLTSLDSFLDPYIQRDMEKGLLTEESAQELIDDLVIKLRLIRHLRPEAYQQLFAGDPTWTTTVIGGLTEDGKHKISKTSYRLLHTLNNLGPSPEPNLTVLYSDQLPEAWRKFCAKQSINTSSIQYESDDLMRKKFGDDYGIACCVSGMKLGKEMQFFGARANLPKLLLYALNGGVDEISGEKMVDGLTPVGDGPLDYDEVMKNYEFSMDYLAALYSNVMNSIHYSHDKHYYEALQMAFHDTEVKRYMAYGVAGLSVVADSLSAIKHAKVTPIRDERGLITDFKIDGEFPAFGNDDDRVDELAKWTISTFTDKLRQNPTYRQSIPTLSALTITSNIVYGNITGNTPDGRKRGEPYAPGANPMHGRDEQGAIASLNSVAKLPYDNCEDGISNTFTIVPGSLGKTSEARQSNLTSLLDGYFSGSQGHHLNVNVLNKETLLDAMEHPEKYPSLTIRVSGYAVHFTRLSRDQQKDVIARTFHESISGKAVL